jgi:hypothetical protein
MTKYATPRQKAKMRSLIKEIESNLGKIEDREKVAAIRRRMFEIKSDFNLGDI